MSPTLWTAIIIVAFVVLAIKKTAVVVPQQRAYVIQRLGKYSRTLNAGFHILIPLFDTIAYRHSLKEEAVEVAEQVCITADNVQVAVDGILYLKVLDPERTSYGINNYEYAVAQLTQTTLRSEIGKLALDKTFEARSAINAAVVFEVDKATEAWGVKVMRYEIKNITPPQDVLAAMEKQMRAEREKRANILQSEGVRDAKINEAEGQKQRVIKESEATMQLQINEAHGKAEAILAVAQATAEGLSKVSQSLQTVGGERAMELRIAEQYITQFGQIAKAGNMIVLPANMSDLGSMIAMAKGIVTPPKAAA
jgi:regulator of protease activity HflC (stomatin/prohibitin superfamily)